MSRASLAAEHPNALAAEHPNALAAELPNGPALPSDLLCLAALRPLPPISSASVRHVSPADENPRHPSSMDGVKRHPLPLVDTLQTTLRRLHDSPRTDAAYASWPRAFIAIHARRQPRVLAPPGRTAFRNDLAARRRTSASTQNQALRARVSFYRKALATLPPPLVDLERARHPIHLAAARSRRELVTTLAHLAHRPTRVRSRSHHATLRTSRRSAPRSSAFHAPPPRSPAPSPPPRNGERGASLPG